MRRLLAPVTALLAALVVAGTVSSCAPGGAGMMTVSAEFPDVGSLAHNAAVELAGVNVGYVSHIALQGDHARLTLKIPRSAHVPASAYAQVRRAAILGPQVIEIVIPPGAPAEPLLADHADLPQSSNQVRPDLEDLIKTGTDVIGALSASDVARLLQENAAGFGGEGPTLHLVIDNLNTVLSGYASRTATITQLVKDLNSFSSALAPNAQADAEAVANLAKATAILDSQKERLTNLLIALDNVSQQGASILRTQLPQIDDQLLALRQVTQAVANQQQGLASILANLQGHNHSTASATYNGFIQVIIDLIVCGVPGGGEDPNSPANSCHNVPAGGQP